MSLQQLDYTMAIVIICAGCKGNGQFGVDDESESMGSVMKTAREVGWAFVYAGALFPVYCFCPNCMQPLVPGPATAEPAPPGPVEKGAEDQMDTDLLGDFAAAADNAKDLQREAADAAERAMDRREQYVELDLGDSQKGEGDEVGIDPAVD